MPYCGPYRVVEVLLPVNYVIENLDGSTTRRVHFNRLKRSGEKINKKSTVKGEKLKESSRNDWPNSDMGFVDVSLQGSRNCHEVTILTVVDQIYGPEVR